MQIVGFASLFLLTFVSISVALVRYPLFPLNADSLDWSNAWLVSTVVDFYGVCLPFCVVILSSERSWCSGIAWSLGCCLLGSPVCCLWCVIWVWKGGTLRIERRPNTLPVDEASSSVEAHLA